MATIKSPKRLEREQRSRWIQEVVRERAKELGMTPYRIAKRSKGIVIERTIAAYMQGKRHGIRSDKLGAILRVLKLTLVPVE